MRAEQPELKIQSVVLIYYYCELPPRLLIGLCFRVFT